VAGFGRAGEVPMAIERDQIGELAHEHREISAASPSAAA
jgi:hypothetical protein